MTTLPWSEFFSNCEASRQLERYYAHLTLSETELPALAFLEELSSQLELSQEVRAHLSSQNPEHLLIYRELTRATYRRAICSAMPRAIARLENDFAPLFSRYLAARATQSRFLRDITWDFLAYVKNLPDQGRIRRYIWELGELEAIRVVVAAAPDPVPGPACDPDLERGLVFSEAARMLSFDHAVHRLPDDVEDRTLPEVCPTKLLAYRSSEYGVHYLELSSLAAAILRELMQGAPLGRAIQAACQVAGEPVSEQILAGAAHTLSDLAERGVILRVR